MLWLNSGAIPAKDITNNRTWVDRLAGKSSDGVAASGIHDNVACPFCGILCDDLTIEGTATGLKVRKNGCDKAIAGFERAVDGAKPQISGKDVPLTEAIAAAAALIKKAHLPIFGGLGTDVEGMRAVMSIADHAGGVVHDALSEGQYRNFRVLQSGGWVMTTLTEARNRADLFIVLGSDLHKLHPRFFERVVCNEKSMFSDAPPKRTVVFLGEGLDQSGITGNRVGEVITLPCKGDRIGEILTAMRALAKGVPVAGDTIGGLKRADVENLVERCNPSDLRRHGVGAAKPCVSQCRSHRAGRRRIRQRHQPAFALCRRFLFGGNEGAVSACAVCAWQSGYPLRVSFASGKPDYDVVALIDGAPATSQGERSSGLDCLLHA